MVERITDKLVKNTKPPAKGANSPIVYDDEIKGFGIRVTYTGQKSFVLNYSINGQERRYTIGRYPDWSVVAARDRAKELKRMIDRGVDPQAQKVEERKATTVKELFDDYKKTHLPTLEKRNQKDILSRPDHCEIANVALMEIKPIRRSRCGFEARNRWPPMIAEGFSGGKIVQAGKTRKIRIGDQGTARDKAEITRKLRPICRFQVYIFACADNAEIHKSADAIADNGIEGGCIPANGRDCQVMFAEG